MTPDEIAAFSKAVIAAKVGEIRLEKRASKETAYYYLRLRVHAMKERRYQHMADGIWRAE
jgi:hypothetical protein